MKDGEFNHTFAPARLGAVRQWAGDRSAAGLKFGLVVSRFNERLTRQLVESAVQALREHGAAEADIEVGWVPGAYEIPFALAQWAAKGGRDAFIALGCVIQGETPHAGLINTEVAHALAELARRHGVPVIDTVVSALTEAQAEARCRPGREGRGWYAAEAAIEMARLQAVMRKEGRW